MTPRKKTPTAQQIAQFDQWLEDWNELKENFDASLSGEQQDEHVARMNGLKAMIDYYQSKYNMPDTKHTSYLTKMGKM